MKYRPHHCHCGLSRHFKKLRTGKLGLIGGVLVVLHLLWHVAEGLVVPAIIIAFSRHHTEAAELTDEELENTTFSNSYGDNSAHNSERLRLLHLEFKTTLTNYAVHQL